MQSAAHVIDPATVLAPPPPLALGATALFADLDGTLAPIEARPQDVAFDERRAALLDRLSTELGGRLAVISGRGLADLDRVLGGGVATVGAVHGLCRRRSDGTVFVGAAPLPPEARRTFIDLARSHPGLLAEDKSVAIALHYRGAPALRDDCLIVARCLAERFGLEVQVGRMVVELRAKGPTKADAVTAFMSEPPFAGAMPVFLGDDLTDEAGFDAATRLGGYGVIVGARRPTQAAYALADVPAALAWLTEAVVRPR